MPAVWNKHRPGYPEAAISIMRGTPFSNPFVIGVDGDRETCIRRFECEVLPDLDVSYLRGQDLLCCCKPLPCHGDSILVKANS